MIKQGMVGLLRKLGIDHLPLGNFVNITLLNILARVVGMCGSVWMARNLEPVQLGVFAFVITCQNPLARIVTLGLDPIIVRATSLLSAGETKAIFRYYFGLKLRLAAMLLLAWLLTFAGVWFTGYSQVSYVAVVLSPLLLTASLGWLGLAQRFGQMRQAALLEVVSAFIMSSSLLLFFRQGGGVAQAAMVTAISSIISALVVGSWISFLLRPTNSLDTRQIFKQHVSVKQGLWPLLISLASFGYTTLEVPVVTALYGFEAAGYYRVGATLPTALYMLVYTFANVMYPYYVDWARKPIVLKERLRQLNLLTLAIIALGVGFIYFAGKPLLVLFFGATYQGSYPILLCLWSAKLLVLWVNVWSVPLLALKQEKFVANVALYLSGSCLSVNYLFAHFSLGATTVALLSFLSELTVGVLCWWRMRRYLAQIGIP